MLLSDTGRVLSDSFFGRLLEITSLLFLLVQLLLATARPGFAEETEINLLRDLVHQLEDRIEELEKTTDENRAELDDAHARLETQARRDRALEAAPQREKSAAETFLAQFETRGALAASYNWNFNNPDFNPQIGFPNANGRRNNGPAFPAVQHNTFQIDQLRLGFGKTPSPETRTGVQVDLLYGVSADPEDGTDLPRLQQAYATYLAPLWQGVEFRLGRWDSPIGAESIYVGENFNITRGLAWFYQPIHHDGLLISGRVEDGFNWRIGVANNGRAKNFDNNNGKSGLFQLGWDSDNVSVRATYLIEEGPLIGHFASLGSDSKDDLSHLLDLTVFWDPSENLSLWLNADWGHTDFEGRGDTETFLFSLAGRHQITQALGLALRAEGALFLSDGNGIFTESATWLTATLDYSFSHQLSLRGEIVFQRSFANTPADILFVNGAGTAFRKSTQVLSVAQLLYLF